MAVSVIDTRGEYKLVPCSGDDEHWPQWVLKFEAWSELVVEPPKEYLSRLRAAGMCTNIWWKLQKQLPGRRQAGQRWVDHFKSALVDKLGFTRCVSAPQFF